VVENNYFDNVKDPHVFYDMEATAQIAASGNVYMGMSATTTQDTGQGNAFDPPYAYDLADANSVKAVVMANAGPL
jgi:pectate lyase